MLLSPTLPATSLANAEDVTNDNDNDTSNDNKWQDGCRSLGRHSVLSAGHDERCWSLDFGGFVSSHNVININIAHDNGVYEMTVNTKVLVGSGDEVPCYSASFRTPIIINRDIFHIDAVLLDIGNNVDVILSMPWLARLGRVTWDFTTMELLHYLICSVPHPIDSQRRQCWHRWHHHRYIIPSGLPQHTHCR